MNVRVPYMSYQNLPEKKSKNAVGFLMAGTGSCQAKHLNPG